MNKIEKLDIGEIRGVWREECDGRVEGGDDTIISIQHIGMKLNELIDAHNESQEPKALEDEPCCVVELGCLCPDENGMSEHDTEKCPCPEHYAKHEEWLRHLIAMAKPQDEPKK